MEINVDWEMGLVKFHTQSFEPASNSQFVLAT